jgi:hypothetical protein
MSVQRSIATRAQIAGGGTMGRLGQMSPTWPARTPVWATGTRAAFRLGCRSTLAALLLSLASCSLVTLKSPEKPLSARDLNARILTHEFAARFIFAVEQTADEIAAGTDDPLIQLHTLRWKIAVASASDRAASQMAPTLGLLDTWALAVQMREYLDSGQGRSLFGPQQPSAVKVAVKLANEAEDMARGIGPPPAFQRELRFVHGYALAHPIEGLDFARASVVDLWAQESGTTTKLIETLGTVPEAMAQASDLMRMYGDTIPSQMLWRAQLAAQKSGISGKDVQTALQRLDERLARLSAMADATPELVNGVVRDVRRRVDSSWVEMLDTVRSERVALASAVSKERAAAMKDVDAERQALATDAARISRQVISDAGAEVRRLVREALALIIVLAIVVLGLPFMAGYLVGRARRGT